MNNQIKFLFRNKTILVFAVTFALVGGYLLLRSFASPNVNLAGDLDSNNVVNSADFDILKANYRLTTPAAIAAADINGDGVVNIIDLSVLASNWGTEVTRAIDAPAIDQEFPTNAVVNVKTAYGVKGDGTTDDTAAIQSAISAALGMDSKVIPKKILYFPKGTYLVSNTLVWKLTSGAWSTAVTLQGENRDQSIIKLKDNAPGFSNAANPQAVIMTASNNSPDSQGSGNEAFQNNIFDLTVDVGQGNPGAVGIDYLANNRAAIRNVVVRAPMGSGVVGIKMTRDGSGPCLLKDVRVTGFANGMQLARGLYTVTMENIDLVGQRIAGLTNNNMVTTVHSLTSNNSVPAVVNSGANGLITLVGASLQGGSSSNPAVNDQQGKVYLRSLTSRGYRVGLSEHGTDVPGSSVTEYTTGPVESLFTPASQQSLGLPISNPPNVAPGAPSTWGSITSYGASPTSPDNSVAIQAALNSGHATVYFPPDQYTILHPLTVPAGVQILGFGSTLYAMGGDFTAADPAKPMLQFNGTAGTVSSLHHMFLLGNHGVVTVDNHSAGTLFLQDVWMTQTSGGYRNQAGTGSLFLEDVSGGPWNFTNPEHVWARQFNPECLTTDIVNNGGVLWVLGLKTERPQTAIVTQGGGSTEVLGGLLYPVQAVPTNLPAFIIYESNVSLIYVVSGGLTSNYTTQIQETKGGVTRTLPASLLPSRGGTDTFMPLYTN